MGKDDKIYIHPKPIIFIDMDNVIVDFESGINALSTNDKKKYRCRYDECPRIFAKMKPIEDAIESIKKLHEQEWEMYICSTSPWGNDSALRDKLKWIKDNHLGDMFNRKVIFTHHKELIGRRDVDYLIDDRKERGAKTFKDKLLLFGSEKFPNWKSILQYFNKKQK